MRDDGGKTLEVRLDTFRPGQLDRKRSALVELAWIVASTLVMAAPLPGSRLRVAVLRLFGARIGRGVTVKPRVRVKFPWRLVVGDHVWLGEGLWIDNLAPVRIGSHCCLSQDAYLCTGSHDWRSSSFDLVTRPITIETGAWVGARAVLAPGTRVGEGAVVALGSVARGDLAPWTIHGGNPAQPLCPRTLSR